MPGLDKFYTQNHVSKKCFEFLHSQLTISEEAIYLEPSAGGGSFLDLLPHYIALDIAPEDDRIEKQDYLKYETDKTDFITLVILLLVVVLNQQQTFLIKLLLCLK